MPTIDDVADGTYKGRAVEGFLTATSKDKPFVLVTFEMLDPAYAGLRSQWKGWLTEKTTDRTMESLRHCGWQGDDLAKLDGITDHEVDLVFKKEKDLKGRWQPRIAWVNRIGQVQVGAPMPADRANALAAALRGAAAASRAKTGTGAPSSDAAFDFGKQA